MRTKTLTIAVMPLILSLVACGGMSEEEANQAWMTTNVALASGQALGATDTSGDGMNSTFDAACQGGGSLSFAMTGTVDSAELTTVNFSYDVDFSDCVSSGTTLNGSMRYEMVAETSGSSSSVITNYVGSMIYSGDVDGSCDSDMHMTMDSSATAASFVYSGTFCGYEYDEFSQTITFGENWDAGLAAD